jgi:CRP-like cAMP-binding protein
VFGTGMYFLVKGDVALQTRAKGTFKTLGDGAYFGELSLLYNSPTTCSIVAVSDCDCKLLDRHDFDEICTTFPQFNVLLRREARRKYEANGPKEMRLNLSASATTISLKDYGTRREIEENADNILKCIDAKREKLDHLNNNPMIQKQRNIDYDNFEAIKDEYVIKRLTQLELRQQQMMKMIRDIANHFHLLKGKIKEH